MADELQTAMNMKNAICTSSGIAAQMVPGSSNRARIGDCSVGRAQDEGQDGEQAPAT